MRREYEKTTNWLWRISATLLLVLFSGLYLIPFIAAGEDTDASLPACCRTHGKHHCMMCAGAIERTAGRSDTPSFARVTEKCPYSPASPVTPRVQTLEPSLAASLFGEMVSDPVLHREAEAWARVALKGARHKRGPPAVRLS
jgi:hypothetical protein